MIRNAFNKGWVSAFARFKCANAAMGAAGYNPSVNPAAAGGVGISPMQSAATSTTATVPKPAVQPTAPAAHGAGKANVLG